MTLEKMISGHRADLWQEEDEAVFHPLAPYWDGQTRDEVQERKK